MNICIMGPFLVRAIASSVLMSLLWFGGHEIDVDLFQNQNRNRIINAQSGSAALYNVVEV